MSVSNYFYKSIKYFSLGSTEQAVHHAALEQEEKVVVAPAAKLVRVDDGDGGYLVQVN